MAETKLNDNQLAQAGLDGESAAAVLTELQTKYAQGKIALAKALTSKGEETAASEDIISMVDKVTNLNTDQKAETLWGPQIESVLAKNTSTNSYYYRHTESANGIVAIYDYQARNLCVYKQTALPQSFTRNEILENSVFLTLDTQLTSQSYSIGISNDGTKIVLCTETEIRLFEYDDTAKTLALTKTLTGTFKYVYGASVAIKNDGSLMFWFYGTTSTYFLDIETETLSDMSNALGLNSSFHYLRECEFFDDKIHAVIASSNYRVFYSCNYTKDENGAVTVANMRYFTMYNDSYSDVRYIHGASIALCIYAEGTSIYNEDKAHSQMCRINIFDYDTWTYYSSMSAYFYLGMSNKVTDSACDKFLNMAMYCRCEKEGDITTFYFPFFNATLRYDKASHILTSDKAEYFYNHTLPNESGSYSAPEFKATKVIMLNYAENDTHIYISAFPKYGMQECSNTSMNTYNYASLVFRKDTFLANVKTLPNGKTTYIKQPYVSAVEIAAGEFDRETIVTPETEESGE